jgi:hypothetical protein
MDNLSRPASSPKIVAQVLDIVTHRCETVTHQLTEDLTMTSIGGPIVHQHALPELRRADLRLIAS